MSLLGISEQDDRRLRILERSYDPVSMRRLGLLGVREDWRCLTLDAGGGAIARWLRQQVGPTGRVVTAELSPFGFDHLPEGPFDMIHVRALLNQLPARGELIGALVSRLWPAGRLLVEESDGQALLRAASGPYRTVWEHACALLGVDTDDAGQLPSALQAAGLDAVSAEASTPLFAGGSPEAQFARLTWWAEQERLLARGLSVEDLEAALAAIEDRTRWFPNWGVRSAWGRRAVVVVSY